MRRRSNQRITKIKKDFIEELLKRAEAMDVADGTSIQPPGSDLIPYPDMNNLRHWTRDYLLKGLTKVYPVKLDTDGQTYLTTLIDGLPLFTKLSKTIGTTEVSQVTTGISSFLTKVGNPTVSSNYIVSNFSGSNYFSIPSNTTYKAVGNIYKIQFTTGSDITSEQCILHAQGGPAIIILGGILREWVANNTDLFTVKANTTYDLELTINSTSGTTAATARVSENGGPFTTVNINDTFTFTNTSGFYVGMSSQSTDRYFRGSIDFDKSSITINNVVSTFCSYAEKETVVPVETSKPGLWLSNLIAPISNSFAGSWLRHNLIHSNESSYDDVNSDVIGNYTWSFFQRGILHRTAGSSHNNDDSYCQHWSPSALGCISHDAIIIPSNNLRSTYTSYQMPVVPNDANMQYYEETMSKDIEYTFVDNNNNIPLTTTQFNGRVVGDGWVYELLLTPNGNGSGNNYGGGDNPGGPNGSNGGCITGTITYKDSNQGTICTQEVNSCFQTDQSFFNPQVPDVPTTKPIGNEEGTITADVYARICCPNIHTTDNRLYGSLGTVAAKFSGNKSVTIVNTDGTTSTNLSTSMNWNYDISASATCGHQGLGSASADGCGPGWCGGECYSGNVIVSKPPAEQDGIDLWLNIYDLKKQYEQEGLPWSGGCGANRFTIDISTEKCTESYCTAKLIAHNVDINALGDISQLEQEVWSNATS